MINVKQSFALCFKRKRGEDISKTIILSTKVRKRRQARDKVPLPCYRSDSVTHCICRAAQNRPKQAECVPIWGFVTYVTFGVVLKDRRRKKWNKQKQRLQRVFGTVFV